MINILKSLRDGFRWGLSTNLQLPDEDMVYNLLEQFDLFVCSDLHEMNIKPLVTKGVISNTIAIKISKLREEWLRLLEADRAIESIRRDDQWQKVFQLCDECWIYCCKQLASIGIVEQEISEIDDTRPDPIVTD